MSISQCRVHCPWGCILWPFSPPEVPTFPGNAEEDFRLVRRRSKRSRSLFLPSTKFPDATTPDQQLESKMPLSCASLPGSRDPDRRRVDDVRLRETAVGRGDWVGYTRGNRQAI
ncbi:hypothetical protein VTH06DRAFT_8369 [Thermothelomyces fergusii]